MGNVCGAAASKFDFPWDGTADDKIACVQQCIERVRDGTLNPKARDKSRRLRLVACAADCGVREAVRYLLDHQAGCAVDKEWTTSPLILAAQHGHYATVELLLSRGVRVDLKNVNIPKELLFTAAFGEPLMLEIMMAHKIDIHGEYSWPDPPPMTLTALHCAVATGKTANVAMLLSNGVDPNTRASRTGGGTSLHTAAAFGHTHLMELLVRHGASVDATTSSNGSFALHHAAAAGCADGIKFLSVHGAHIDAVDIHGSTALHLASERGRVEAVETLLSHGADPNIWNTDGLMPWHLALLGRHTAVVRTQLLAGVDISPSCFTSYVLFRNLCRDPSPLDMIALLAAYGVMDYIK